MCSPTDRDWKASWLSWLSSSSDGDTGVTGFDAGGWAASTWVLHFMYESPDRDPNLTYDDLWRTKVASGAAAPLVIGSINLDEVAAVVGNSLGLTSPKPEWVRLRWAELAERLHIELAGNEVPPCWRWFPYRSWPSNLVPPDEGSLDGGCVGALVEVLAAHSAAGYSTPCVAYYCPLANGADFDNPYVVEARLGDVAALVDPGAGRHGTPSNFWPVDRSWMVFTDWDLWGTKVSGSTALIEALRSAPAVECIDWVRTT